MKIAVIAPYFYPRIGGLENYAYHISKGLKEKYNWNVVVITSNHQERVYKEEKKGGITIYKLPRWFKISNTPINPLWYFQIRRIVKKEKPDVINAHAPVPFMADLAALANHKKAFILTYHTGKMASKNSVFFDSLIKVYESIFLKITLRKASKIICSSNFIRLNFLKTYSKKTTTITPGVDINKFKPRNSDSTSRVLFVGSLNKADAYKGLDTLLQSIKLVSKKIKNIKLVVMGDGNHINYYQKLSKDLGLNKKVIFKGKLLGIKKIRQYQNCNLFVLPSTADSFGTVIIEAMACAKPVIGANAEGIPYVIENNKNGLLIPARNPEKLAIALIKILTKPSLARRMGQNGYRKVIESYSWNKQVQKTKKVIEEVYI